MSPNHNQHDVNKDDLTKMSANDFDLMELELSNGFCQLLRQLFSNGFFILQGIL